MTDKEFNLKLQEADTPIKLVQLADKIFDGMDNEDEIPLILERFSILLDKGLDPSIEPYENDDWVCLNNFAYLYTEDVLPVAKKTFEKCGVPEAFYSFIRTKMDYDCFDQAFIVKLYLLASAYTYKTQETYLKMSDNLFKEMFDKVYRSVLDGNTKLDLTPEIFKDIEKYDFCVEMKEQKKSYYGCWELHIFDKESKIEVAIYQ